ncbi:MAG: hypothetical protein CL840_09970 [Crocinitomicaceae bacterium]|nr:hypothetical protein [Crocinitomicaceae bacterium]|tara:strand:- start:29367 stop:30917 length:1551 start_codon:yes stop_codon:yes gene_type:complete
MKKITLLLFVIIVASCDPNKFAVSDVETKDWKPLLAAPLFTAELKVTDLLREINESSVIKVNEGDGFMTLVLQSNPYTFDASKVFDFKDIEKQVTFILPTTTFPVTGKIEVSQQIRIPLVQSTDKLYSVLLGSGVISLVPATAISGGTLEVSSPNITKAGTSLALSGSSNGPMSRSLKGYQINLANGNELVVNVKLILTGSPGSNTGFASTSATLKMESLGFKLIKCYLSQRTIADLKDTFNVEMFDLGMLGGSIDFFDPRLTFYSQNSFGGSLKFIIDDMGGIDINGQTKKLVFGAGKNEFLVRSPMTVGGVANEKHLLQVGNSLNEVLRSSPNKIFYKNRILLNEGITPSDTNFILDTSKATIKGELELPLQLRFPVLDVAFERNIDWSSLSFDDIEFMKFEMEFYNKFPLELRFQCVFLDENKLPFDSLFSHGSSLFNSEPLNSQGRISNISAQKIEVIVDQERANSLKKADRVLIKLGFNTADKGQKWVRFYDDYRLGIKCKIMAKASYVVL